MSLQHVNPITIKALLRSLKFLHRQILQTIHHPGRICKVRPQSLPPLVLLAVTVVVQPTLGVWIDILAPHFPLDEQNSGVGDAALVEDAECRDVGG